MSYPRWFISFIGFFGVAGFLFTKIGLDIFTLESCSTVYTSDVGEFFMVIVVLTWITSAMVSAGILFFASID